MESTFNVDAFAKSFSKVMEQYNSMFSNAFTPISQSLSQISNEIMEQWSRMISDMLKDSTATIDRSLMEFADSFQSALNGSSASDIGRYDEFKSMTSDVINELAACADIELNPESTESIDSINSTIQQVTINRSNIYNIIMFLIALFTLIATISPDPQLARIESQLCETITIGNRIAESLEDIETDQQEQIEVLKTQNELLEKFNDTLK